MEINGQISSGKSEIDFAAETNHAIELSRQWNRASVENSFEIYRKLATSAADSGNKILASRMLREASILCTMLGKPESAFPLLKKALEYDGLTKNLNNEAQNLILISHFYSVVGNVPESEKYLSKAVFLYEKTSDDEVKSFVSFYAGEIYFAREDIPQFSKFYTQAVEFNRKTDNKKGEAQALFALSYASIANDRLSEALDFATQSYNLWKGLNETRGETLALSQIGISQFKLGKTTEALSTLIQAENSFSTDVDKTEKAILAYNIGKIYENFGDCQQAISHFKNSLELLQNENNLSYLVGSLWTLGSISYQCNSKDESLKYLNKSLDLAQKLNKKADEIHTLIELGKIYTIEGDYKLAEKSYRSALGLLQKTPYMLNSAKVYEGFGALYEKTGNTSLARKYYLSALNFYRKIQYNFEISNSLFYLARIDNHQNKLMSSVDLLKESIKITDSITSDVSNSKLKSSYFSNIHDRYELYISLLMKMQKNSLDKKFFQEALITAEKSRARILLENLTLADADLTNQGETETISKENEIRVLLNTKADKLTDLLSQKADKIETDKISIEINELENELENIKAKLKQQSPVYSAIKNPAPFDVAEFQQNVLDENSMLLEFSLGNDESYLWVVDKTAVNAYILPPRGEIENRIIKLRSLLESRKLSDGESLEEYQKRINRGEIEYQTESKILSNQLFGQIAGKLSNKRLIIVADGKLHYFPLAALPSPIANADEPLLLTNEIVYAPSAQSLLLIDKTRQNRTSESAKNLLIFSDPIFTENDTRFSAENSNSENSANDTASKENFRFVESLNSLPRLTASKNENEAIVEIVGSLNSDSFSGFRANREQLINVKADEYKILHFATHGITNEERPELSGIVLSGFDERGQKQTQLFRIHDIYGLNLNADLVVLSACETGIGKEVKGEGLMSLNNAFLQTGARSVMASLWKVEDNATLELMKNFYDGMANENLTPSQSLRQAQIKLRQNSQYKSPFYWAAFTVQGDFRNVPQISAGFSKSYYAAALIPFILLSGFLLYRKFFKFRVKT